MDTYVEHNAKAWDWEVTRHNIWTDGCSDEQIEKAKNGVLDMVLSPFKTVPSTWLPDLPGKQVLALACGGGQQGVLLSLAQAKVTVFDISTNQLAQDKKYAEKLNLDLDCIQGDMQDLSCFADSRFDVVFNPTSSCVIDDVVGMYRQVYIILKPGGYFLTSITNPALYLFDEKKVMKERLHVKYTLPYSDLRSISKKELEKKMKKHDTLEFSHTLADLLCGLTDVGFILTDMYTDKAGFMMIDSFLHDCYLSVRAKKEEKCL